MPNTMTNFNFVSKDGDTMSGDLNLGFNRLLLTNGVNGGIIKGEPMAPNWVLIRTVDDSAPCCLSIGGGSFADNITMNTGKGIDGVDLSEINQAKIKVGYYTGDGNDDRDINIGIPLIGKFNVYIIIKANAANDGVHRAEMSQGDLTSLYDGAADTANCIKALTSTGFRIGTDAKVNNNGTLYRYIVIYEQP